MLLILIFVLALFIVKYAFMVPHQSILKYGLYYLSLIASLLILLGFLNRRYELLRALYYVLIAITVHAFMSLLAWFVVQNNLHYVDEVKSHTFWYIFWYAVSDIDVLNQKSTVSIVGLQFRRISGIFWEPGILQLYVNILLHMSFFYYKNILITILSLVVIISTWSTTGLVILALQIAYYLSVNAKLKNIPYILFASGLFLSLAMPLLSENLTNKIYGESSGSGYARALDTYTALNIIAANPIFGIPLDSNVHDDELMKHHAHINMEGARAARDPQKTNSVLNYFVLFGIPLGIAILSLFYRQRIFSRHRLLFFVLLITGLSTEPIGFMAFPLMLMFSWLLPIEALQQKARINEFG